MSESQDDFGEDNQVSIKAGPCADATPPKAETSLLGQVTVCVLE